MALIPILPEDIKVSSIKVHPTQNFVSSSAGYTGDVFLFAERSVTLKTITDELKEYTFDVMSLLGTETSGSIADNIWTPRSWESTIPIIKGNVAKGDAKRRNISGVVNNYLNNVQKLAGSLDDQKKLIVYRFDMPHRFNANTVRKSVFIKSMLPFYQNEYEKPLSFGFTNYHCLNFFTSSARYPSDVPSDSAILFPSPTVDDKPSRYFPSSSFSYEFYINPRYTTDYKDEVFHAGTIMNMPNCYSISMVSGSGKDSYGRVNTFRLMLQLGFDASLPPGHVDLTVGNQNRGKRKIFLSTDVLKKDVWSYCAIRWGGASQNFYTGSFFIDGQTAGEFVIEDDYSIRKHFGKDTVSEPSGNGPVSNQPKDIQNNIPAMLVIGNKFNSTVDADGLEQWRLDATNAAGSVQVSQNTASADVKYKLPVSGDDLVASLDNCPSTADKTADLFDDYAAYKFGVEKLVEHFPSEKDPDKFVPQFTFTGDGVSVGTTQSDIAFNAPLNAELQEIRIFGRYRTDEEIISTAASGYYDFEDSNFLFYLPPMFVPESSMRRILETPSQSTSSVVHTPFNTQLSFGLGARSISLENFCRDLVTGAQARCHQLHEQEALGTFTDFDADDFDFMPATEALYLRPQNRKRNLSILPSDNGTHRPQFTKLDSRISTLTNGSSEKYFINDQGYPATGRVSIRNMIDMKQQYNQVLSEDLNTTNTDGISEALLPPVDIQVSSDGGTVVTLAASKVYGQQSNIDLVVLNRTKDTDSNEITFFDISNMFYGDLIKRESFVLRDPYVTGSAGKMQLSFRDNGMGELYRCDASGSHPTWSAVGNIIYEEGMVCLMNPTIPPFGMQQFNVDFRGDRNIHMLEMRIPISADEAVSSSNPTFSNLRPTNLPADAESTCNLITNMFIHDENLNVVGKVNLSRPIVRKENDRYVFRFKMDF